MSTTPTPSIDERLIVRRKQDGTASYGLYVDVPVATKDDGKLMKHHRWFLAGNMLCRYVREAGFKRASWKVETFEDHDTARKALQIDLARLPTDRSVLLGEPLLVELSNSDLASMKLGQAPNARHNGTTTLTNRDAVVDDETWQMPKVEGLS